MYNKQKSNLGIGKRVSCNDDTNDNNNNNIHLNEYQDNSKRFKSNKVSPQPTKMNRNTKNTTTTTPSYSDINIEYIERINILKKELYEVKSFLRFKIQENTELRDELNFQKKTIITQDIQIQLLKSNCTLSNKEIDFQLEKLIEQYFIQGKQNNYQSSIILSNSIALAPLFISPPPKYQAINHSIDFLRNCNDIVHEVCYIVQCDSKVKDIEQTGIRISEYGKKLNDFIGLNLECRVILAILLEPFKETTNELSIVKNEVLNMCKYRLKQEYQQAFTITFNRILDELPLKLNEKDNDYDILMMNPHSLIEDEQLPLQDEKPLPALNDIVNHEMQYEKLFTNNHIRIIGRGGYGEVFIEANLIDHKEYAIKEVHLAKTTRYQISNEINMMKSFNHRNIISCKDSFMIKDEEGRDLSVKIAMDLMDGGSLHNTVNKHNNNVVLSEPQIAYLCKESLQGLNHLHSHNIIHRDIKADNVLLGMDGSVKVADLGLAVQLTKSKDYRTSYNGTDRWMAPEITRDLHYGKEADIWSFGIMAMEMAEGNPPHCDLNHASAVYQNATQNAPTLNDSDKWSPEFRHFLKKCLDKDPTKRFTTKQLLMHKFLNQACTPIELIPAIKGL